MAFGIVNTDTVELLEIPVVISPADVNHWKMNGDVPTAVEHTNSAFWVSSILNEFGAMVATGGTVRDKSFKTKTKSGHHTE